MASLKEWVVDEAGMAEICRSEGVRQLISEVANEAVAIAQTLASGFVWSGAYLESLGTVPMQILDGKLVGGFGSDSSHWHFVEYGSPHNPPRAILRNAAIAAVGGTGVEIL